MPVPIRFHLDEHVASAVASGLRARGVDVTTVSDVGLLGATDQEQLDFARSKGRVVVTHDDDFLSLAAGGHDHAGICYCHHRRRSTRQIIEMLFLLHECFHADDMKNQVEFL